MNYHLIEKLTWQELKEQGYLKNDQVFIVGFGFLDEKKYNELKNIYGIDGFMTESSILQGECNLKEYEDIQKKPNVLTEKTQIDRKTRMVKYFYETITCKLNQLLESWENPTEPVTEKNTINIFGIE